ncbi:MAG: hypothetical protein IJ083_17540 [Clostridia bacterium]|nr:hypothetical protein [Clostridia bacterium]
MRKLRRADLLEIMVTQQRHLEEMQETLNTAQGRVDERERIISDSENIAQAALHLAHIEEDVKNAAELYLLSLEAQRTQFMERTKREIEQGRQELMQELENVSQKRRPDAENVVKEFEAEAEMVLQDAKKQADAIVEKARQEMDALLAQALEEKHQLEDRLKSLSPAENKAV